MIYAIRLMERSWEKARRGKWGEEENQELGGGKTKGLDRRHTKKREQIKLETFET